MQRALGFPRADHRIDKDRLIGIEADMTEVQKFYSGITRKYPDQNKEADVHSSDNIMKKHG